MQVQAQAQAQCGTKLLASTASCLAGGGASRAAGKCRGYLGEPSKALSRWSSLRLRVFRDGFLAIHAIDDGVDRTMMRVRNRREEVVLDLHVDPAKELRGEGRPNRPGSTVPHLRRSPVAALVRVVVDKRRT